MDLEKINVHDLMEIKGGTTPDIVCHAGTAAVECKAENSGVINHTELNP